MTKEMPLEEKANKLLFDTLDGIEEIIWRFEWKDNPKDKMVLRMIAGLSLAETLRQDGIYGFLRAVVASIVLRIKFPKMIELRKNAE